jgi:hypothetical protein
MRNAHGHGQIYGDGDRYGLPEEFDTFMCAHCNRHSNLLAYQQPTDVGGYCSECNKAVCRDCAAKKDCFPIEKLLEAIERKYAVQQWF